MVQIFGNYKLENFLETICWEIFGKYMLGIFGTVCWEMFWKLYAGKCFGSHMLENPGGCQSLFEGGNYGTMLQSHTMV